MLHTHRDKTENLEVRGVRVNPVANHVKVKNCGQRQTYHMRGTGGMAPESGMDGSIPSAHTWALTPEVVQGFDPPNSIARSQVRTRSL